MIPWAAAWWLTRLPLALRLRSVLAWRESTVATCPLETWCAASIDFLTMLLIYLFTLILIINFKNIELECITSEIT